MRARPIVIAALSNSLIRNADWHVRMIIEELIMTTTTGEIAAFMAEPILGVGGFIVPPPGYFERAVEITRKHGGLLIADEVQTAWGRTGDKWFGIETGTSGRTLLPLRKAWATACRSGFRGHAGSC